MELLIFGHAGARLLIFPTSKGRFYEWEDRGMMGHDVLGPALARGWIQAVCVDSVDAESWYARWKHPNERGRRNTQYDAYLANEVLPLTRQINDNPFLITVGASFGAYHALNFALRHPELTGRAIGLSGIYNMGMWSDGFQQDQVYFNDPSLYLRHESDAGRLAALQALDIILVTGQDDPLRWSTEQLSSLLWGRGVWHALRIWDGWSHDWPYWKRMLKLYLDGHD